MKATHVAYVIKRFANITEYSYIINKNLTVSIWVNAIFKNMHENDKVSRNVVVVIVCEIMLCYKSRFSLFSIFLSTITTSYKYIN